MSRPTFHNMTAEQLNAYYAETIGYRPQEDDPNMTYAELLALCLGVSSGPDFNDEWELLEEGRGDMDTERATGRRCTDLWQWSVVLPGEDEDELLEHIGDMDVSYALAAGPWKTTVFSGALEDLEALRARILGK